jgi:RF-1 domain
MAGREKLFSVTIHDCVVETKRGHGKGGQNRNTRDTAVRITHPPSGAVGESQEQRSQLQNKRTAWERLIASGKFRVWLNREIWLRQGLPSPEEEVREAMAPQNLRVEIKDDRGRWVEGEPQ